MLLCEKELQQPLCDYEETILKTEAHTLRRAEWYRTWIFDDIIEPPNQPTLELPSLWTSYHTR